MVVDLHNHSYYSDGVLSPTELARLAKESDCDVLALTDHDTTAGLSEAKSAVEKLGIKFITGVEVSAMWNNITIHIVGLNIDVNNQTLQAGLQQHQAFRQTRALMMARGLAGAGIVDAMEKTQAIAKTSMITRTHFAQMLIQEGICKNMKSVFGRFLTGKKPGGVRGQWASYDMVIEWIHAAGGVAVLAHPLRYRIAHTKVRQLLSDLSENGCDGVEVVTGTSSIEEINLTHAWAQEFELLQSVGSDYHGWQDQTIQLGRLQNLPNVDNAVWKDW